jgi:hypothetical protein
MRQPTARLRASTLGDAIGMAWFLREVDGVGTVGHGGSANGQFAELLTVPERDFAVVALSNAGPDGTNGNQAVVRGALETYLGVTDRDQPPLPYDPARARELVGNYEMDAMTATIGTDGSRLRLEVRIRPEIRAAADKELPPDIEPSDLGLLPGDADERRTGSSAARCCRRAGQPAAGRRRRYSSHMPSPARVPALAPVSPGSHQRAAASLAAGSTGWAAGWAGGGGTVGAVMPPLSTGGLFGVVGSRAGVVVGGVSLSGVRE